MLTPANIAAALLLLIPYLVVAFAPAAAARWVERLPLVVRLIAPATLCLAYIVVSAAAGSFRWKWLALYALLPAAIAVLLWRAGEADSGQRPESPGSERAGQRGTWLDFLILATLGLSVDLRWFERAWPPHMAIFNKVLLLDAGIYGFVLVRRLGGTGFNLKLGLRDFGIGLREVCLYTPIALALGLWLGFLHAHAVWPRAAAIAEAWFFTFFFIALPEELFFRGWMQNLLEKRIGRNPALLLTAVLFGLAHFNKHTPGLPMARFNWRYVLLAALAGIFYGRAWRRDHRVGASAVTHATVDSIWSLWLH
jgi:membrane protease YdiL (CAAX protease family)